MSKVIFLRRKKLGLGSVRGMSWAINGDDDAAKIQKAGGYVGDKSGYVRNDFMQRMPEFKDEDVLVRWGCTSITNGIKLDQQLNKSMSIKEVGDKRGFRMKCEEEAGGLAPKSYFKLGDVPDELNGFLVVRRATHSQGKDLWLVGSKIDLEQCLHDNNMGIGGWYASDFINKKKEFRVYVVEGRVVSIAEKTPEDPNAIAWNVAQGAEFSVLKWGEWDKNVCDIAIQSFNLTSLDFAGIDIMTDEDGRAYLIEINSAPSLPFLEDGRLSYRQKVMANAFKWIADHGKGSVKKAEPFEGWRDVIHPCQWQPKEDRKNLGEL